MTDERRESRPAAAKSRQASAEATGSAATARPRTGRRDRHTARSRPERYLIGVTSPTDVRTITAQLEKDPSCTIIRTIGDTGARGGRPRVAVAEMSAERALELAALPGLLVEPDQPLTRGMASTTLRGEPPVGDLREIAFEVADDAGRPIEGAAVSLIGAAFPTTVFTDASGRAEASVPLEAMITATALVVHPARGCWPVRVPRPQLLLNEANRTVCPRITTTHPDFPDRALDSWGRRVMGFDRLPPSYRGHATRIALIDSGVAAGHPDLTERIPAGRDIIGQDDKSWQEDHIGTGTHHAVLIAGRDDGTGVVGLAPDAEVHVCRVTPGGWAADLIEALDFCIEQQIDVALIACAIPEPSALVAAKIDEARRSGVACVAAAGDAAGPIYHPAALPGVLSVGAIGQLGTFPADSAEITQLAAEPSPEGLFPARFSNGGPGLDCCAPGVAIISGLPPTSYGPLSGTATAAAHVAAVAALVLAHHPMFRPESGRPQITRDSTRVDRLFEVIKASCRLLPHLDPRLTGAGIPDAAVAVGVAPWGTHTPLPVAYSAATGPLSPADPGGGTLAPLTDAMRAAGLLTGQDES